LFLHGYQALRGGDDQSGPTAEGERDLCAHRATRERRREL
jgi:hypothetical protein